ncbi:hypothetical protein ACT400_12905 [Acinetobacter baumannii]
MDNYKIINTHTNEIIKALNDLGYVWTPKKFDKQDCLLKAHWILAKETGEIAYSSGTHIDSPLAFKELTLPQLRDLVVLKRKNPDDGNYRLFISDSQGELNLYKTADDVFYVFSKELKGWDKSRAVNINTEGLVKKGIEKDPALISGDVALANVHKHIVQYLHDDEPYGRWTTITDNLWSQYHLGMFLDPDTKFKFRFKPQTIKVELELPKPFEPQVGEWYFFVSTENDCGYSTDKFEGLDRDVIQTQFGAYRTANEVEQVVEQLRKIRGTNS